MDGVRAGDGGDHRGDRTASTCSRRCSTPRRVSQYRRRMGCASDPPGRGRDYEDNRDIGSWYDASEVGETPVRGKCKVARWRGSSPANEPDLREYLLAEAVE